MNAWDFILPSADGVRLSTTNDVRLPLHDPTQWPLRLTKAETAYVCRRSVRTIERNVEAGLMPPPDHEGFFLRKEIADYLAGGVRRFARERERLKRSRR